MAFLLKKLNIKATLAMVVLAGVTAGLFSGVLASAAGPEFNKFPITYTQPSSVDFLDYPLLDARPVGGQYSTSQSDHNDGVTVNPGEEIEFSVYYHNGVPDDPANTAVSTVIKAFSNPALGQTVNDHWVSATIEASNAAIVSSDDPARGGSMQIHIAGSIPQSMSLVTGSVKQFKNWGSRDPANGSPDISSTVILPNSIFTGGVNIGNVQGCWPFFGFVSFRLKVSNTQPTRGLEITKSVLNVTNNQSNYSSSADARENDFVRFKVDVTATGAAAQTGVIVSDTLPSRLTFASGDNLEAGINVGTMQPNETRFFIFDARVNGSTAATVTNTARVRSNEVAEKTAQATVRILSHILDLGIQKTVRNVTNNENNFVETTNAKEGDIVEYQVVVNTSGTGSQTNIIITDTLHTRLEFVGGTDLRLGHNIGTLNQNASITLLFQARVLGSTSGTIINTARVKSDQVAQKSDTANVVVSTTTRNLTIQKKVLNFSRGESAYVESTNAFEGEIVSYQVVITTSGNASQSNVIVTDPLTSRLQYTTGDDLRSGFNAGTLAPNTSRTFVFQARVLGSSPGTITNTARVKSDQVTEKTDTASVVVASFTFGLSIQKTVRNVTNSENNFVETTNAKEGDIVEYRVVINASGTGGQTGVTVSDSLNSRLQFVSGDDVRGSGISLGSLNTGESRTLTYQARILGSTATGIVNTARVRSNEVSEKTDTATVNVQSVTRNLTIQKTVRNVTNSENNFVETTNAKEGDIVEYRVVITTTGNGGQTNIIATDSLATRLEFTSGDDLRSGLNIGDLSANQTRTLTYQARILGSTATTITNTARVKSDQVTEKTDTATVKVLAIKAPGDLTIRP